MVFKAVAALALIAATGSCTTAATGSGTTAATGSGTTLGDSHVTFKSALGACEGALGTVTFSLGHARIAAAAGIATDVAEADPNAMMTATFQNADGTKKARVEIDQKRRSVSAKNLRVEMRGKVACILPD